MNIEKETIINRLNVVRDFLSTHAIVIFIIFVVIILAYLSSLIAIYASAKPDADAIVERKKALSSVKLDEESIAKLNQLQDKGINIRTLFDNGRTNPFE
jgi:hypothetical protein